MTGGLNQHQYRRRAALPLMAGALHRPACVVRGSDKDHAPSNTATGWRGVQHPAIRRQVSHQPIGVGSVLVAAFVQAARDLGLLPSKQRAAHSYSNVFDHPAKGSVGRLHLSRSAVVKQP